jgi:hypothetical protein
VSEHSGRTGDRRGGEAPASGRARDPSTPGIEPSTVAAAIPSPDLDDPFSTAEVKQLWSFLDGAIMDVHVRHQLWRSWGLCPRHAWGYAIAEVEARGGRPFSTSILYEDLVGRAARLVGNPILPWPLVLTRLRPRGVCFTCDYVALARSGAEAGLGEVQARMNGRRRVAALLAASRSEWRPRACPECLGGEGPICRPHLLAGARPSRGRRGLAESLSDLRRRLHLLVRSMTWRGPVVGPAEEASWIEALAWFGGWPEAIEAAGGGRAGA